MYSKEPRSFLRTDPISLLNVSSASIQRRGKGKSLPCNFSPHSFPSHNVGFTILPHNTVTKPITSPNYYGHLTLADKRCGNSSLFINSWEGISELGPRRHKETHQQCVLFAPDPVTTARLETHNVYPDIGTHGARAGMRRNR
ncbi:hypothetical protein TNCV_184251 [Trichonephila clavipes]|nr:hypothetical protein TNCV_184251 [Trichonephila clavipes]